MLLYGALAAKLEGGMEALDAIDRVVRQEVQNRNMSMTELKQISKVESKSIKWIQNLEIWKFWFLRRSSLNFSTNCFIFTRYTQEEFIPFDPVSKRTEGLIVNIKSGGRKNAKIY